MKTSTLTAAALCFTFLFISTGEARGYHRSRHSSSSRWSTQSSTSSASSRSVASSSSAVSSSSATSSTSSTGKLWGAYVGDSPSDATAFENLVGKKMDMQAVFVSSDDSFPAEFGVSHIPLIFWEPSVNLDAINAGQLDSKIKTFAAGAKASGGSSMMLSG